MTAGYEPNLALGPTYKGFAGPQPARSQREQLTRKMVIGGVASALVLGLAVGLWAKPQYRVFESKPMAPVTASTGQVDIVVDTPPPSPAQPVSQGRLEVLPPDMAAAAQAKSIQVAARAPREAALPQPILTPAVSELAPVETPRPAPRPVATPRVAPRPLAVPAHDDDVIDCRNPSNGEEAGICRDIAASDDRPPPEDFEARFGN